MAKRHIARLGTIAWIVMFGWSLASIAAAETHREDDVLQIPNSVPLCQGELLLQGEHPKARLVREVLSAFEAAPRTLSPMHSGAHPTVESALSQIYASTRWAGERSPWPGFNAFFEHEVPGTAIELSYLSRASRIEALSSFDALRLTAGYGEDVDPVRLLFLPKDPFRTLGADTFITRKLSEQDYQLWNQSLVIRDGVLIDVREVLEARIYYRNRSDAGIYSPFHIRTPFRQEGNHTDISVFPEFQADKIWNWLWWGVVEYLLGNDQAARMAGEIKRVKKELIEAGYEIMLIEFPHSHPFDSYLLTFQDPAISSPVRRITYPMFSDSDKTFFSQMIDLLGRDVPIAMSVVSGLSSQRLSKEYAIVY